MCAAKSKRVGLFQFHDESDTFAVYVKVGIGLEEREVGTREISLERHSGIGQAVIELKAGHAPSPIPPERFAHETLHIPI